LEGATGRYIDYTCNIGRTNKVWEKQRHPTEFEVDVDEERKGDLEATSTNGSGNSIKQMTMQGLGEDDKVQRSDIQPLVDALLPAFRELLAKRACSNQQD